MNIYLVPINNSLVEFRSELDAQSFATLNELDVSTISVVERNESIPIVSLIETAILKKQEQAPQLLREIFAQNTAQGITTEQSVALFQEHTTLILCILVGAFPSAYAILNSAQPSGFMTQERLDAWKVILSKYI